jgi:hypothetical protein
VRGPNIETGITKTIRKVQTGLNILEIMSNSGVWYQAEPVEFSGYIANESSTVGSLSNY